MRPMAGVYISVALIWLWLVEGMRPTIRDWAGVAFSLVGMAIIAFNRADLGAGAKGIALVHVAA